jgi:hypothetical protein
MASLLNLWTIQDIKLNLMNKKEKHQMLPGVPNIYRNFLQNIQSINKMFYYQLLTLIHGYLLCTSKK